MGKTIFITGTDTGVGKTVLTGLLLAHLRSKGIHALAMKPFCSGSRADAELFFELQDREIPLEEVNPFYFKLPVAPLVAARKARRQISLNEVFERIGALRDRCDILLIEGAGGLFVPLGNSYSVADLVQRLRGSVVLAARNKLGVLNHTLLTFHALEGLGDFQTSIVLMGTRTGDVSSRSNAEVLAEFLPKYPIHVLPFLKGDLRRHGAIRQCASRYKKWLTCLA